MNRLMTLNPEFVRNAWLELSPQRLIIAPVVIFLIGMLVWMNMDTEQAYKVLNYVASGGFVLTTMVWGLKSASDSVLDEYNERTWDWQKMSVIGSWKLAWGKLFGSTIYQWYVGGLFLILYIFTSFRMEATGDRLITGFSMIIFAITVQCAMIMFSLLMMKRGDGRTKIRSSRVFFLGLFFIFFFSRAVTAGLFAAFFRRYHVNWYGVRDAVDISLITAFFYCIWAIIGLDRSMRAELQYSDKPGFWVGFLLSGVIFMYGFAASDDYITLSGGIALTLSVSFFTILMLGYILALTEPKDIVNFRLLADSAKARHWNTFWQNVPLWPLTIAIAFIIGFFGVIASYFANQHGYLSSFKDESVEFDYTGFLQLSSYKVLAFYIAMIGFVVRDISILLLLHFSPRARRSDTAMIVYLIILYVLMPALTGKFDFGAAFYPSLTRHHPFLMAGVPLIEGGIAFLFLRERWKGIRQLAEA
jgi:hypothetical protein